MKRLLPLLGLLALGTTACEPTCRQTCKKLVACEEIDTPRLAREECESSCELQEQLYDDWDDQQARDAFGELKTCIRSEECSAVADGVCYDEEIFIW